MLQLRRWFVQVFNHFDSPPRILFIFGSQRSGTTLLTRIFEGDASVCSYAEHSLALSRPDHYVRTRTLPELAEVFQRCKGHLIVAKPLVESHRASEFLEFFPESQAVWAFRNYRDVVASFVKRFGSAGVNILSKIIEGVDNWASESVSRDSRDLASRFYSAEMSNIDAAAIFWLIRNELFFTQNLGDESRVTTCRYAELVSKPNDTIRSIYSFVEVPYPGRHLVGGVYQDSHGHGRSLPLHPEIESLCESMWRKLKTAHRHQTTPPQNPILVD